MVLSWCVPVARARCEYVENIDIDSILSTIRDEVARRRAAGEYPPGLENELEAEFRHILSLTHRGDSIRSDEVSRLLGELQQNLHDLSGLTPATSRIPGVSIFHRVVRRLIARHTMGLAAQARSTDRTIGRIVEILAEDLSGREDADKRMVAALSKHVLDRVAVVDHLVMTVTELESKVRALEGKR